MIDALLAFEGEVHRQVTELADGASAAEQELQVRTEAASAADSLIEEARKRASEIAEQASLTAQGLLMRAQRDIEALQLDSQRELIAAFREYLQQVETAQSTLLRIARRALSTLIADVGETPELLAEHPVLADAPAGQTTEAIPSPSEAAKVQSRRRAVNKPRRASKVSEPESEHEGSETPGPEVVNSPIAPVGASTNPGDTPNSARSVASRRRSSGKPSSNDQGNAPQESDPGDTGPSLGRSAARAGNGSESSQTDVTILLDGPHNLIDLRNRHDLERLDDQSGPIMRAINRRRSNGSIQEL